MAKDRISVISPFTPFRIENAQCNVAFSLKSAHEMGRLNEKWCKKESLKGPLVVSTKIEQKIEQIIKDIYFRNLITVIKKDDDPRVYT
jgi:hypothetical protein